MILLIPATIDEIRDNWQFFVTGIGEVIDRCAADFHPADVYREITAGNGPVLFWVEDRGETLGFTVVNIHTDPYSRKRILNLDMTYLLPHLNVLEGLRDAVDVLAQEHDCSKIEWFSPRQGWNKVMTKIGYQSDCQCFSREVTNG